MAMDSGTEEIYFQKLQEYVQDEDKSVTIPSLASILKISVQDAKYILSKYVEDQRKLKPKQLALTYVLTGCLKDKGSAVVIVKETELEEKKSLFDKIESETLFSVQKCKDIDFNALSLVYDVTKAVETTLLGTIVSKNCLKRTLKVKKLPPPPPSTIKGKSSFFLPKSSSNSSHKSDVSSASKDDTQKQKLSTQINSEKNTDKKSIPTSSAKTKGGLSAFFSKGSSSSSVKSENGIKKEISANSGSQPSEVEELMDVDFQEFDEEFKADSKKIKKESKIDVKEETQPVKPLIKEEKKNNVKKSEVKNKNKNKREREKSQEKSVKKRKRIVERNDSESDDMFENDEDVIEKSDDEPERAPSPVEKKPLAPKNKIRKAVEKTYMDEEGFIVTKAEYVYESAPEDDEPPVPVKKEPVERVKLEKKTSASSENDVSPPKGAKGKKGKKNNMQNQPTLMNFFKKK